jgi:hypothetical protein
MFVPFGTDHSSHSTARTNTTLRYSHLVPEHKAQAVAKLGAKFEQMKTQAGDRAIVSPELKEANRRSFAHDVHHDLSILKNLRG